MNAAASLPTAWREAVIERIVPRTAHITSFYLRAPWPGHAAGQHVDVRLTAPDGYQAQRSYSIASAPAMAGPDPSGHASIELVIDRLDDGEVSPFFHDVAQAGDTIELRGPLGGHFVWRPADGGPLLLIAGGSGIVPLMAMVREWAAAPQAVASPTLLVCAARTWEDIVCSDEWTALQETRPDFGFIAATTRGPKHRSADIARRLDAELLREILGHWGHTPHHAYVCGSNAFVESATGGLTAAGLQPGIIRTERYGG
ncbi:FAD-binding oxidoreductase [soil metagenome]